MYNKRTVPWLALSEHIFCKFCERKIVHKFFNCHSGIPDLFIISTYARSSASLNITMRRGLRSCSSARSMNLLADSPCNVGIIFTGVAILLLPFDSRCKISQNSPKLQGIGKISAKKKENQGLFCRNLFNLLSDSRKFTIFVAAWGRNPESQMH